MNKAQLIDALAERLGDRKLAAAAVAGLVDVVIRTVGAGERVTITGFGVFEKRARAARTARNPRTGQAVPVQQTDVPAFRPGTLFREVVSGARTLQAGDVSSRSATSNPVPINPSGGSNSRTTVTAATHLGPVQVAGTKGAAKAAKAGKATKANKTSKAVKAAKALKAEPKGAGKGTAKKAGKKSDTKR